MCRIISATRILFLLIGQSLDEPLFAAVNISMAQPCQTYLQCDDSDACTFDDCINSECSNPPIICDDFLPCTIDGTCDPQTGNCSQPQSTCQDDGNPCTIEYCYYNGCQSYTLTCDDGNACTDDHCEPANGECKYDPAPQMELDIQNPLCNGENGTITPVTTGGTPFYEYFIPGYPSFTTSINVPAGSYEVTAVDINGCATTATAELFEPDPCDDGIACNGLETCKTLTGECIPGDASVCDDSKSCTTDGCDFDTGECTHKFDCNLFPTCCDDGNLCTNDFCEPNGTCSYTEFTVTLEATDATCFCNGAIDLTTNGGNAPMMGYFWSNNSNDEDITGLCSGEYSVTVYDAVQCSATATVTITGPEPLEAEFSGTAPICNGGEGLISQTTTGGNPPYTYTVIEVNGLPLDQPFTIEFTPGFITDAGEYLIEVSDANGCSITRSVTISNPAPVELTLTANNPLCNGENGFVFQTTTGGTAPYQYFLSAAGDRLEVYFDPAYSIGAGTHIFEVEDANGCTATATVEIIEPELLSLSLAPVHNICPGECIGSIDLTISGGNNAFYGASWSNNTFDEDLSGLCAGTYSVTVYDASQCSATVSVEITQPAPIVIDMATVANPTCFGACNGIAEVASITGGTAPYTYEWLNHDGTQTIGTNFLLDGLCGNELIIDVDGELVSTGQYFFVVTDANGCEKSIRAALSEPKPLELELLEIQPKCHGSCDGAIDVIASGVQYSLNLMWNNPDPASTGSLDVGDYGNGIDQITYVIGYFCAGTYTVSGEDSKGCTASSTIEITEPELLELNLTATPPLCHGQNGTVSGGATGGTPPYHYYFLSAAGDRLEVYFDPAYSIAPGTYTFEVEDASGVNIVGEEPIPGCITTITIEVPDTPECAEDSDPCTNDYCDQLTGACKHNYDCNLSTSCCSDNNLCTNDFCVINNQGEPECVHVDVNCNDGEACTIDYCDALGKCNNDPVSCDDNDFCTIDACFTNNSGEGQCSHQPRNCDDNNICTDDVCVNSCQNNPIPNCCLTATDCEDNNLCTNDFCITINQGIPECTHVSVNCNDGEACTTDYCDALGKCNNDPVSCDDNNFCTIDACFTNNLGEAECSHQPRNCDDNNICTDDVCVNGCQNNPIANCCHEDANCEDNNPCTFDKCTENECENNPVAGCCLTAIDCDDENLCTTDECNPNHLCEHEQVACDDGEICTNDNCFPAIGCVHNFNCFLSTSCCDDENPCTVDFCDVVTDNTPECFHTPVICDDQNPCTDDHCNDAGICKFTPIDCNDENICTNDYCDQNTGVCKHDGLIRNADFREPSCNGLCDGFAEAILTGGTPPYTYAWDNGETTPRIENLCAGEYLCTVTDANGCIAEYNFTLLEPELLQLNLTGVNPLCHGGNGTVTASATGGTEPYTFKGPDGAEFTVSLDLPAGIYTFKVIDDNGCTSTETIEIIKTEPLSISLDTTHALSCLCNGEIDLTVAGGTGAYTYAWENGDATEDRAALCSGSYLVTVTDANECAATAKAEVIPVPSHSAIVKHTDYCDGSADIKIFISGFPPHVFSANGNPVASTVDSIGRIFGENGYTVTEVRYAMTVPQGAIITSTDSVGCAGTTITLSPPVPFACDDANLCTNDACVDRACVYTPVPNCCQTTAECNDGDACTTDECVNHTCQITGTVICDDGDACTFDFCDGFSGLGICRAHFDCTISAACCDDGNPCTIDACFDNGGNYECLRTPIENCCQTEADCDDENTCTDDICATGQCEHRLISNCCQTTAECEDNDLCTVNECVNHVCVTTPVDCDDNDACTSDRCLRGDCLHAPLSCDDENSCTNDFCDNGCKHTAVVCNDNDACTDNACNPLTGCVFPPVDCSDSNPCTNDFCNNGCKHTAVVCNDNDACTDNACNPLSGCVFPPVDCSDNNPCTNDFCNNGCKHTAVVCNDNDACTDNACNPLSGCVFPPVDCSDNNPCTNDFCNNGCKHTPVDCNDNNVCTGDFCNPNSGCFYRNNGNMRCSDNNACTINDRCIGGSCIPGTPRNCNDLNPCTTDGCVNGQCVSSPKNCNDNNACTVDACIWGVCVNVLRNCFDGNACTDDVCENGICLHNPRNCDDGDLCTNDGCFMGLCSHFPRDCSDSDFCTTDACANGGCIHTAVDCIDHDPCTIDQCLPSSGCVHLPKCDDGDPCTRDYCRRRPMPSCDFDDEPCPDAEDGAIICLNNLERPYIFITPASPNIYIGYAPAACVTLTATPVAGLAPFSFLWSNGETTSSITICPVTTTWYYVTVTDAKGCSEVFGENVCVRDIRCGTGRVSICHRNQQGTSTTLCVNTSAVPGHLAHGDRLGPCGLLPCITGSASKMEGETNEPTGHAQQIPSLEEMESVSLSAYPNPFSDILNIEFTLAEDSRVKLEVFNLAGQRVAELFEGDVKSGELQKHEFAPGKFAEGMFIYRLQTESGSYYGKAVMTR